MGGLDPMQLLQQLQALPEAQRAQAAASMGLSVEQLQQQLQQFTQTLMAAGMGGQGALPPGGSVIRLTQDELSAVRRLQELGFTEQQAAQAFLACDKDETLAANYLFDGNDEDYEDGGMMPFLLLLF